VELTFYGVRGSCPCAGDRYRRVGGNTSCALVTVEGEPPLILDLGTGLRAMGDAMGPGLRAEGRPLRATALLTHLHFDHILGLPFFGPLHDPGAVLTVYGPQQEEGGLEAMLSAAVQPPFFPVHMADFRGEVVFKDTGDDDFSLGTVKVRARSVPHRGNTLGFRVEADGRSLAYLPDHQAPLDRRSVTDGVLELCGGADLVVHDAQYSDEEFSERSDWGHSTVAYAVRVAAEAGAKRLLLYHHDPSHDDRAIEQLLAQARRLQDARRLDDVSVATEGMTVDLGAG
jgi:ribonuclease BN (tRNA processing enzyme)